MIAIFTSPMTMKKIYNSAVAETKYFPNSINLTSFCFSMVVLDFNGDGLDDLAVGAPAASFEGLNASFPVNDAWLGNGFREWGKVFIYTGQKHTGLASNASVIIETTDDLTGLGTKLFAVDINGDDLKRSITRYGRTI